MSGAIEYMLDYIERELPGKLLDIVFKPRPLVGELAVPYNVMEVVRQEVINKWLIRDINLYGTQDITLPLSQARITDVNFNQKLINIPKSSTGGRRIIGVSKMGFFNPYAHSSIAAAGIMTTTEMQSAIAKIGAGVGQIPRVETGYITMVTENTFLVEDLILASSSYWIGVTLESDEYLSFVRPPYWRPLAEIALNACKAVIYKRVTEHRDGVIIEGGAELGSLNDMVSGWSDAHDMYKDEVETKLQRLLAFNDRNRRRMHMKRLHSA